MPFSTVSKLWFIMTITRRTTGPIHKPSELYKHMCNCISIYVCVCVHVWWLVWENVISYKSKVFNAIKYIIRRCERKKEICFYLLTNFRVFFLCPPQEVCSVFHMFATNRNMRARIQLCSYSNAFRQLTPLLVRIFKPWILS